MNDLEICKRISKIEDGNKYRLYQNESTLFIGRIPTGCVGKVEEYNPLTDDALCFKLMVKYEVGVDFVRPKEVNILGGEYIDFGGKPNKAICLAIIEANKD